MEELDEEVIIKMAEEYADSRMQFFKPWEGSYHLAVKNAFVNAYTAGYYTRCKEENPEFTVPEEIGKEIPGYNEQLTLDL